MLPDDPESPEMAIVTTPTASDIGKQGGKARAKNLTPKRRREIARNAARARWKKQRQKDSDRTLREWMSERDQPQIQSDGGKERKSVPSVSAALKTQPSQSRRPKGLKRRT